MPGSVQSIERAAAMLHLLAASPSKLSLGEVAGSLDLAKGTAHGILRTLADIGFVEQDRETGRYRIGAGLLQLGGSYLDENELRARAVNWADTLASRTDEAVRIGTLQKHQVLIIHHVFRPDDTPQTLDVGSWLPAHATALGKVLLASAPAAVRTLTTLERYTSRTITSRAALESALAQVRGTGASVEMEEWTAGIAGLAAPIRGHGGLVVGAIGIRGPVDRICLTSGMARPALLAAVIDAARAISRELETGRR
jgi:DNA-binding IclR family transcriptional regulator